MLPFVSQLAATVLQSGVIICPRIPARFYDTFMFLDFLDTIFLSKKLISYTIN